MKALLDGAAFPRRRGAVAMSLALGLIMSCGQAAESASGVDAGARVVRAADAGTSDAGTSDAGTFDAGTFDAGTFDAGTFDAGTFDAGTFDAGTPDAGRSDAGTFDAGTPDAGTPDAGGEVADAVFLWGTDATANSAFFSSSVLYAGYGPFIHFGSSGRERFGGQRSVEYYQVLSDLRAVTDPFFSAETNQRVELGSREEYQALGVAVGSTVWFGWSQVYEHIGPPEEFTDFQIRSQADGVTGSPAAEFSIKGDTKNLSFNVGSSKQVVTTLKEGVWYDFVLEFKYSYGNDGLARVWAAEAGDAGQVLLDYSNVAVAITGRPTMHNGTTFLNTYADTPAERTMQDSSPHLRWGVYTWGASVPASLGEYYRKYLGTVRIKVGALGQAGFNAVLPRSTAAFAPDDAGIAIGKPTTLSSRYLLADGQYAVDGRTSGNGPTNSGITHTNSEAQPYFEVDLQAAVPIQKLVIWNTASMSRLNGLNILVSTTPCASASLSTCLAQPGVWSTTLGTATLKNVVNVPNVTGRYIRLQRPTTGILSLVELQVF